jgi:hypothetical protein
MNIATDLVRTEAAYYGSCCSAARRPRSSIATSGPRTSGEAATLSFVRFVA